MASVDSVAEAAEALAAGWRYYRVAFDGDIPQLAGESICPGSAEAGKLLTCIECRHCDGERTGRRGSVVIRQHGREAALQSFRGIKLVREAS
jgi:hypothetical protein